MNAYSYSHGLHGNALVLVPVLGLLIIREAG